MEEDIHPVLRAVEAIRNMGGVMTKVNFAPSFSVAPSYAKVLSDDNTAPAFRGFAQAQAHPNNNSPRNPSLRNASSRLRYQAITFVSASTSDEFLPKKKEQEVFVAEDDSDEEDEDEDYEEEDIDESSLQTNIVMETEMEVSEAAFGEMKIESPSQAKTSKSEADVAMQDETGEGIGMDIEGPPLFVVDTVGDPTLASRSNAKGKQPVARSPSPTPSNSSEEIVVFQGRNKPAPATEPPKRTKFKDILTRAADGGFDAFTTNTAVVRPQNPPQQSKPETQGPVGSGSIVPVPQIKPIPPPQTYRASNWQSEKSQRQQPRDAIGWGARTPKFEQEVALDAKWAPAPAGSWWKNKSKKLRPDLDLSESERLAIEQKIRAPSKVMFIEPKLAEKDTTTTPGDSGSGDRSAEETIASLQAEVTSTLRSKRRARQTTREQDEIVPRTSSTPISTSKRRGKRGRKKDNRELRNPVVDVDDEEDDVDDAAFVDYMSNIAAQQVDGPADDMFGTTAHASAFGPSLVVDGEEIGEDEVLPSHLGMMNDSDSSSEDEGPIGLDTSEISSNEDNFSDFNSSELEDELEYTEREQWEDEEDLRQRRRERMTDEQVARLFAKQQELGIDDDELVIDDGEYMSISEEVDGIGDVARARAGLANIANISFGRNKHGMRRPTHRRGGDFTFPDASALADTVEQYGENGFDIMDFDRPSLRPTKKGRKGNLPPELEALEDDELKENLRNAWSNDRRKKSAKKAEREDLRMQGLLGAAGRAGKADLSAKYPFGMTTAQIQEELRIFLDDENQQSRPFPPMGKNDRKALHEIAAVLKLGSKSVGSGKDRYPVLNKTARTHYTPQILERAVAASSKGFLGHGSKTARKLGRLNGKDARSARGGFGGTAAATLRHGEVVGAGAAEISQESFGHKLMEKMGWSKGMALGKEGEGMLLPVEQKVRLGTAGLG